MANNRTDDNNEEEEKNEKLLTIKYEWLISGERERGMAGKGAGGAGRGRYLKFLCERIGQKQKRKQIAVKFFAQISQIKALIF